MVGESLYPDDELILVATGAQWRYACLTITSVKQSHELIRMKCEIIYFITTLEIIFILQLSENKKAQNKTMIIITAPVGFSGWSHMLHFLIILIY